MVIIKDEKQKKIAKNWHPQQEKILKIWGEQSACYRWMHYRAYEKYKKMSMGFTLPIIIISTVTGTANFAQETFPDSWKTMAPVVIGGLNLFAAIMTTILQFLKVNELLESHRVSSLQYGKLSRHIRLQLTLPVYERTHSGDTIVETCWSEYDRMIEQSPPVPDDIVKLFEKCFPDNSDITKPNTFGFGVRKNRKAKSVDISRPEIIKITEISPYDITTEENNLKTMINNTIRRQSHPPLINTPPPPNSHYENIKKELNSLKEQGLVQNRKLNEIIQTRGVEDGDTTTPPNSHYENIKKEINSLKEQGVVQNIKVNEIIQTREVEDGDTTTTTPPLQNTEPEHVTIEISKVSETKKLFEKI